MKVAIKLALALLPCAILILALSGWLSIEREIARNEGVVQQNVSAMGRSFAELVRQVWRDEGPEGAQALVRRLPTMMDEVDVRWVWVGEDGSVSEGDRALVPPAVRPQLAGGEPVLYVEHTGRTTGRVLTYVPLQKAADGRLAILALTEPLVAERTLVRDSVLQVVLSSVVMACVFLALAVVVGLRVVGRPTQTLLDLTRRVGEGDFSHQELTQQRDEIGELAREMDAMCTHLLEARERLELEVETRVEAVAGLRHADRLATLGKLAAGVAHEVGTPLGVVKGWAELIAAGDMDPEKVKGKAERIVQLCQRMSHSIQLTLGYAHRRAPHKSPNDLLRLTRRALSILQTQARQHDVELAVRPSTEVHAEVDEGQIEQVVINLALNGIYAAPRGGKVLLELSAERRTPPEGKQPLAVACLEVRDDGPGIEPKHLEQLWEPFFTTRPPGQGTGLGLPIARGIVEEHGGWIEVESFVGKGTSFRVFLPLTDAAQPAEVAVG